MKNKVLFASFMIGMLLVGGTVSMEAQAATTTHKKYNQSHSRANQTNKSRKPSKGRKVAGDVGRGTKDTGKGIAKGSETAGEKVAGGSEMVAKGTVGGAKDVGRATGKAAQKTGKVTAKTAKKIGNVFK